MRRCVMIGAAVLLVVAWNIAEVPEVMRLLRRAPREDLVVLIATIAITVFTDLTYAIAFGVVASMFLLLRQMSRLPAAQALLHARLVPQHGRSQHGGSKHGGSELWSGLHLDRSGAGVQDLDLRGAVLRSARLPAPGFTASPA